MQKHLTNPHHWNKFYQHRGALKPGWSPKSYDTLTMEYFLSNAIRDKEPTSILEVGCGDSSWLPYLARKHEISEVAGIDYSSQACKLARDRLEIEGIEGDVQCADLFEDDLSRIGTFEFVYSIGVVEHFSDTADVVRRLARLVKPGGTLLTDVPNLRSIHGFLSWLWQPDNLAKHILLSKKHLLSAYDSAGFQEVSGCFYGLWSMSVVPWDLMPRWPKLARVINPYIKQLNCLIDYRMRRIRCYRGIFPLAPFLCVVGRRKAESVD